MREAADRLRVAAPSLSAQIASLEAELGGALFQRHARGVSLTQAGRVLYAHADRVLTAMDGAKAQTRAAITGDGGVLTFGTVLSVAAGLAPRALAALSTANPKVDVVLHEYRSAESLEQATMTNDLDFGIGPEPRAKFPFIHEFGREELVLVVPPDLADRHVGPIDLKDLADQRWVTFKDDHGLGLLMESRFLQSGIAPQRSVSTSQTDVAIRLAAAGLGPTLVPSNVVPPDVRHLMRSLEPRYERQLFGYSRAPFTQLTKSFFDLVTIALNAPEF